MNQLIEKSTDDLMNTLQKASPAQVQTYLEENFSQGQPDFTGYIDELLTKKHMKRQDVFIRANLPPKYGYKLLTREAHTTNRDKIIRICLAIQLSLKETQRVLKLYGMSELYPKSKRDVILIVALGKKQYDINLIDEELVAMGLQPLFIPDED